MASRHIYRDYSAHRQNVIRPYDEYTKLEIFSFDPKYTKTYLAEDKTLKYGENYEKTSWKSWTCYRSLDKTNDVFFSLDYNVKVNGSYRIDVIYEKSNHIYTETKYNTGKNLVGNITIQNNSSKDVYNKNHSFGGVNNVTKRKTVFIDLNKGNHKINVSSPPNCYLMGVIVRKVIKYIGDNYYGDALGSEEGNLAVTTVSITNSDMTKPTELSATILYDDRLECDDSPSGFYIDYHDEVNFYVKNDSGETEQIFGGYVSSILPDSDRTKLTLACADRLVDGQNKYVLDQMRMQGGTKNQSEDEYKDAMTRDFTSYPQALKYLCNCHETTLMSNISKDYTVDGEKFHNGISITFGSKKLIKKIKATNGESKPYNNYIMLRNKSSGDLKQVWTLYDASKVAKKPLEFTNYGYLHITYGLGAKKTEYKTKTTEKVDVSDTTAGSQKFGKCGQSKDKKYLMAIGQYSGSKGTKSYNYHTIYKTIFKNKCPHCGGELVWDRGTSGTKCVYCGGYNGSKRTWGNISETEITCKSCCADYDSVTGYEKDAPWKKLTKASKTVKSSKAEQNKLANGEMVAVPTTGVEITPTDILSAIAKLCKKYKYKRGTDSTYTAMKKSGQGDCWAFSELILSEFRKYKVRAKIVEYRTNLSDQHRSVIYLNANKKWVDFPYKEYGLNKNLYATSKSLKKGTHIIDQNKDGSNIGNAKAVTSTSKSQTTTVTNTKGFDKDKPFNAYLLLTYSIDEQKFKAKKYNLGIKFTLNAPLSNSLNSGLALYWINNTVKQATLKLSGNKSLVDYLNTIHGDGHKYYLQSLQFITPKQKATDENKDIDWYKSDNSTNDNSSCKLNLYQITLNDNASTEPSELNSCGKSVNAMLKEIVDKSGYYVNMTYATHRKDDKINFRVGNQSTESYTATEGDNNNILSWNSISYTPISALYNNSTQVFKGFDNMYYFIDTKNAPSILAYGEQCTLATSNEAIGKKEAYFNAVHSDKFNPVQTYNFTITVRNMPKLRIGDLVRVVANAKKLNTIKEVQSIKVSFDYDKMPRIRTEIGLGELAPDIQLKQNIRTLRQNAKEETTEFSSTAIAVTDPIYYEWDR